MSEYVHFNSQLYTDTVSALFMIIIFKPKKLSPKTKIIYTGPKQEQISEVKTTNGTTKAIISSTH